MKILISNDGRHALYYFRLGLARALSYCGHEVIIWDLDKKSPFDAFDEFEPDLYLGQTYNLNDAIIKCVNERPHLKVGLRASDFGNTIDRNKYPILYARDDELDLVDKIINNVRFLHIHHHPDYLEQTHGLWSAYGYNVKSVMNAADVFDYTNGKFDSRLETEVCFVGGYWGYKAQTLSKWILPLTNKVKIFGNQPWPTSKYCGFIPSEDVKNAFTSAKVCPNVSEPHSQDFGYDIIERPFKVLSNKSVLVSDCVQGLQKLFPTQLYARTPAEMQSIINDIVSNKIDTSNIVKDGYNTVINAHTYFHRAAEILNYFGVEHNTLEKFEEIKNKLNL